jgi:hypothetical protein
MVVDYTLSSKNTSHIVYVHIYVLHLESLPLFLTQWYKCVEV